MCSECDWEAYLEKMEGLIENERYQKSMDFLVGVYEWVEDNKHITDKQIECIDKIG